jgi:hypothetical protein
LILGKIFGLQSGLRRRGHTRAPRVRAYTQSSIYIFTRILNTLSSFGIAGNPFEIRKLGGVLFCQIQRTAGPAFNQEFADAYVQGGRQCIGQLAQ